MEKDINTFNFTHHGVTIDPADDCKLYAPVGSIIKVRDNYAICKISRHYRRDCECCVGRYPIGLIDGLCSILQCTIEEREDGNEVYFELIDNNE